MTGSEDLPAGVQLVRTTVKFDQDSVPAGLLRDHRVAEGVWGRLVVSSGHLTFLFEDSDEQPRSVSAGESVVIPPNRPHHLEVDGPVTFVVEFHRPGTGRPA